MGLNRMSLVNNVAGLWPASLIRETGTTPQLAKVLRTSPLRQFPLDIVEGPRRRGQKNGQNSLWSKSGHLEICRARGRIPSDRAASPVSNCVGTRQLPPGAPVQETIRRPSRSHGSVAEANVGAASQNRERWSPTEKRYRRVCTTSSTVAAPVTGRLSCLAASTLKGTFLRLVLRRAALLSLSKLDGLSQVEAGLCVRAHVGGLSWALGMPHRKWMHDSAEREAQRGLLFFRSLLPCQAIPCSQR